MSIRSIFAGNQHAEPRPLREKAGTNTLQPLFYKYWTYQPSAPSVFNTLLNEMIQAIGLRLDQPAQSHFVLSSSRFHSVIQPQRLLNKFLQYVVYGNQKKAEAIIKAHPELLTKKGTVVDYSGRTICGTALQIALGAEDVKYHGDEECMAEMLMRYLKQLLNSETIITEQIQEQFPKGWEEKEKARQERDLIALKEVVEAIENAREGDNYEADIQAFRDYLDNENKERSVIRTGKHFNAQLLVKAFNLYVEKYDLFGGNYDSPKNTLFWCKIIGYIERYLPACYAQAFCQGLYHIVECHEKLDRRLTFRYDSEVTFFPLDAGPADPAGRLGYHYALDVQAPSVPWYFGVDGGLVFIRAALFQSMSNKKHQRLEIMQQPNNQAESCCVVM